MLFDNCLEELDAMEDIDDDLYVKALFIFMEGIQSACILEDQRCQKANVVERSSLPSRS